MKDLELHPDEIQRWFERDQDEDAGIVLVRVSEDVAASWVSDLVDGARRCYVSDDFLERRASEIGVTKAEVLSALLPDPGPVMSGDFGEIVAFVFLAAGEHPADVIGPKKWRLKQDRLKPAPYSDVVQFVVPNWPDSSDDDRLLCAEVKTKSTDGNSTPVASAIADSEKDRLGRLAKTLAWLRERALVDDLGTTSLALVGRFLEATDHPPADKRFWAVAVVCTSILEAELRDAPETESDDYSVAVIGIPQLKNRYEEVFEAIRGSTAE